MGNEAETSKLLSMVWSVWWPAPIWKSTKSQLIRTKCAPVMHTGSSEGFRSSVSGIRAKDQTLIQKMLLALLLPGKLWGFWSRVSGTGERYIYLIISCWLSYITWYWDFLCLSCQMKWVNMFLALAKFSRKWSYYYYYIINNNMYISLMRLLPSTYSCVVLEFSTM